jgi:hypothetical protein
MMIAFSVPSPLAFFCAISTHLFQQRRCSLSSVPLMLGFFSAVDARLFTIGNVSCNINVRLQIFTEMIQLMVFWVMTPCSDMARYQRLGKPCFPEM